MSLELNVVATRADIRQIDGKFLFKTHHVDLGVGTSVKDAHRTTSLSMSIGKDDDALGGFIVDVAVGFDGSKVTESIVADLKSGKNNSIGLKLSSGSNEPGKQRGTTFSL